MQKCCGNSEHTQARITMQEINTVYKYDNTEILSLTIIYPKIELEDNPDVERRINRRIAAQVEQYINHAKELYKQAVQAYLDSQAQGFPFHAWEARMEYSIAYNGNCFLSMYTDRYEFTGGAHGNTIRTSETWELTRGGMQRSLESFFAPGVDYRGLLIDEIIRQADENITQQPGIYFDDYQDLIAETFNPQSFYLTPDGLVIYYQQYDIAPYSTGIVEFTIPYETIGWHPHCPWTPE